MNNWDLVDTSAPYLGMFLIDNPSAPALLESLARSEKLWERRVAMLFTFASIRADKLGFDKANFAPTIAVAELLVNDGHDLIHKAVGWMLREVGNRDLEELRKFLNHHAATMPRTMLRYAIEKLEPAERKAWLNMKILG